MKVISVIYLLTIGILFLGCGSGDTKVEEDNSLCLKVPEKPCGGDITGEWVVAEGCFNDTKMISSLFGDYTNWCEQTELTYELNYKKSSIEFTEDGMYTIELDSDTEMVAKYSLSSECLSFIADSKLTNAEACSKYHDKLVESTADEVSVNIDSSCNYGKKCECIYKEINPQGRTLTETYELDGSKIKYFNGSIEKYCIYNEYLVIYAENSNEEMKYKIYTKKL